MNDAISGALTYSRHHDGGGVTHFDDHENRVVGQELELSMHRFHGLGDGGFALLAPEIGKYIGGRIADKFGFVVERLEDDIELAFAISSVQVEDECAELLRHNRRGLARRGSLLRHDARIEAAA